MDTKEIVKALDPWKKRHERIAYKPKTRTGDGARTASKFAGAPWLASHESPPACGECKAEMAFFLQIDLSSVPQNLKDKHGDGLLQLFYCTTCDGGWEPFSKVSLVRIVPRSELPALSEPASNMKSAFGSVVQLFAVKKEGFRPKTIVEWIGTRDYPHPEEFDSLGLMLDYNFKVKPSTTNLSCDSPPLKIEGIVSGDLAEEISMAEGGDKLGGWPRWIQGREYPSCPRCGEQMPMLFQLDSEDNLDYMFGDLGTGHITQCKTHKDVVAFGWACS